MVDSLTTTLEVLNGVTIELVESLEPWTLDVDALVVAVGPEGFGGLGQAMIRRFPAALARDLPFLLVTPERPLWLDLSAHENAGSTLDLKTVILATAHDARGQPLVSRSSPPTVDAAATGLLNALQLADERGAAQVGATLLGTGRLGFDAAEVAAATVPRIHELIVSGVRRLRRIVLVAGDRYAYTAIAEAWRSLGPGAGELLVRLTAVVAAALPNTHLSGTAGTVLARALAQPAWFPPTPDTGSRLEGEEVLLAALHHQAERQEPDVATAFVRELATATTVPGALELAGRMGDVLNRRNPSAPRQSHEQLDALPLVRLAAGLAERTVGQQDVHQRHLLAAALTTRPLIDPVLSALGVDDAVLRRCLRAAIAQVVPAEAPTEWDQILLETASAPAPPGDTPPAPEEYSTTDLAGGYSTDLVNPEEKIPASADLLGINTYVSMLAHVIASEDTPLPLSIGLFGEWGSGKSFFMGRLRQQIAELSTEDGYLDRIEQIGFNAWHYADTNLWASLGDEIFRQLARPQGDEPNAEAEQRRSQLMQDLGKTLRQERELEAATANAQHQAGELRAQLDTARAKQGEAATLLLKSVASSKTLNKQLRTAWNRLGVSDEAEQGELLLQQIRGVRQDVDSFRKATTGRRGLILAALVICSVLALAAAVVASDSVRNWLVSGGLLGLAGGLTALTAFMGRVGSGARLLAKVAGEAKEGKDAAVAKEVQAQVDALNRADADADILTTQLAEVRARAADIGRQLAELAPGQRFYGFVADRAASQDYQSKLGLISTIRRDFEKLIQLMRDWRDHPEEHGNQEPIDRIVLYIDDLDRCSPDQVVEVLQAVHLLLALDLFVVVVGVDPRWLLHSLEQRYRENFATDAAIPGRPEETSAWDATPLNYLEKIFNIPFVLPGMTKDSFADLISGWSAGPGAAPTPRTENLVVPSADRPPDALPSEAPSLEEIRPAAVPDESPPGADQESPAGVGVAVDVPVEAGSAVDQIGRGHRLTPRPLSTQEIAHLRALAPLVQTPREAKRVFNLYRTLRASGNLSPASVFLGDEQTPGEFQAVLVLLGLLTAEPRLVGDLLFTPPDDGIPGGICHRPADTSWSALLKGLTPKQSDSKGWCNDLGELGERPGSWEQVLPKLRQASTLVTLADLTAFQRWGPLVARFSFILSPLAAGASDGSPVARQPAVAQQPAGPGRSTTPAGSGTTPG